MNVLINAVSAKSGGATTYIENLVRHLSPQKNNYVVVLPSGSAGLLTEPFDWLHIVQCDVGLKSPWARFVWDQFTLRRLLREYRIDLLVSSSDFGMLFSPCPQLLLVRNAIYFSALYEKVILPRKRLAARMEHAIRRWLIILSTRFADRVITASQAMLVDLRRYVDIPHEKAVVAPFGVSLERFAHHRAIARLERNDSGRECRFLYVSEYGDYKNIATLLKAVRLVGKRGRLNFRLAITMDPNRFTATNSTTLEDDLALATTPEITRLVEFLGSVPYAQIFSVYQQNDVLVFPSLVESFGHPLVEAMASGIPIIASDIRIHREICGGGAVYFDPLSEVDLADKMEHLATNVNARHEIAGVGLDRANAMFKWSTHVRRFEEIVSEFNNVHT